MNALQVVAEAADIADNYDEIAVEPSVAPDGAGWFDVYVDPEIPAYHSTVPGEVLDILIGETDVEVYDRLTGDLLS